VSVLVRTGRVGDVTWPYRASLAAVLPQVEKAARPYGILAFVNVILAHDGQLPGFFDATHVWLEREAQVIGSLAKGGFVSRELAYVALGAGRLDLARSLTRDAALLRLVDAAAAGEADPFYDFVAAFPEADASYAELMFVARAFVSHLEERGPLGIAAAAAWAHDTVRYGRRPLVRYRPIAYEPIVYEPIAPRVRTGPSPLWWSSLTLENIHPLHGGHSIAVSSLGDVEVVDAPPAKPPRRVRATLDGAQLAEIDALLARHDPRTIRIAERPGVADEGWPTLTLVAGAETSQVGMWANDRHPDFDALAAWLWQAAEPILAAPPSPG
jgi:hypothetical protein